MADLASQALTVRFLADTGNLNRGLDGITGRFRAVAGGLGAIATAGAAVGAVSFMKKAVDEAREAATVMRQTEAVLRSTAGVANITATGVDHLATRLSNLAGVDDEVIAGGINLMLTFTRIRNEMGAGNDIFNQATQASLNLSSAMGTSLQSAVIMVGKALNDPVKGITAMSRAGIQFTEDQKAMIISLAQSGDMLGAQKIILRELETQFGGMAAASADAGMKAKVAWDNMVEAIGTRVLPMFNAAANFITTSVVPAVDSLARSVVSNVVPAFASAGSWIGQNFLPVLNSIGIYLRDNVLPIVVSAGRLLADTWTMVSNALKPLVDIITNVAFAVIPVLAGAVGGLVTGALKVLIDILGAVVRFFNENKTAADILAATVISVTAAFAAYNIVAKAQLAWLALQVTALNLVTAVTKVATGVQLLWNAVLLANPVGIVIGILAALVAAFVYAWQNSETFRNVLTGVWDAIMNAVRWTWENVLKPIFEAINVAWTVMGNMATNVWTGFLQPVFNAIGTAWTVMGNMMSTVWHSVISPLWEGIKAAWNMLGQNIGWVYDNLILPIFNALRGAVQAIGDAFGWLRDTVKTIWDAITKAIKAPVQLVIDIVWNNSIRWFVNKVASWLGLGNPLGDPIRLAGGGVLPGYAPGRDTIPAMLSPGEAVLVPELVQQIGASNIIRANKAASGRQTGGPMYAGGGVAGDSGVWRQMKNVMDSSGLGARITSTYRRGDNGWHGKGKALDLAGNLGAIANWLKRKYPNSTQIIYGGAGRPGSPGPNVLNGRPHWFARDAANHLDHVHWAMANAGLLSGKGGHGGGLENSGNPILDIINWFGDIGEDIKNLLLDPVGAVIGKVGDNPWTRILGNLPVSMLKSVGSHLWNLLTDWIGRTEVVSGEANAVPGTLEQWADEVVSVLRSLNQPENLTFKVLRRMKQESGGNPRAINNWDSNAKKGTPSKGLMQVIDPTFQRYKAPFGSKDIWDPWSNIYAALNYSLHRYGSIAKAMDKKGGYAGGGIVPQLFDNGGVWKHGQLGLNMSGHDEVVLNHDQQKKLGGEVHKHYHLTVYATNSETDIRTQFQRMEDLDSAGML